MEGFLLVVVVALVAAAGVLAMDDSGDSYDISIPPDNSLPSSQPPPQSPGHSLFYEPPPLQERDPNYKYGSPHQSPQSSGPSLTYGPPPPPPSPSSSLEYQHPSSYGNAFSLFDDSCGRWKALSLFLVSGIALVGLTLVFGLWSLPLSFSVGEDDTSKLTDPALTSSVYEQIGDISRILMAIKNTNDNPKHDQVKEVDQGT